GQRRGERGVTAGRRSAGAVAAWPIPLRHRVPSVAFRPPAGSVRDGGLAVPLLRLRVVGGRLSPVCLYHAESGSVRLPRSVIPRLVVTSRSAPPGLTNPPPLRAEAPALGEIDHHRTTGKVAGEARKVRLMLKKKRVGRG